jgi:hypothetical protein
MATFLMILTMLSLFATLGVMFAGMIGLVRQEGGLEGGARSNRLMRLRVALQALTLVLFLLLMAVGR